eukprot:148567_1
MEEEEEQDDSWAWFTHAILWMIPISMSCTGYLYCIYSTHLRCRRNNHSATCSGTIIHRWVDVTTNDDGSKDETFHIKYRFDDRRVQINEQWLPRLFDKFLFYPNEDECPMDVINICVQYLGMDAITFWYGPFIAQKSTSESKWKAFRLGTPIEIQYDTTNPQNCTEHKDANVENAALAAKMCFMLCNIAITVGIVYGVIDTIHELQYDDVMPHQVEWFFLLVSLLASCCLASTTVTYSLCWRRRTCCFKRNLEASVNVSKGDVKQEDTILTINGDNSESLTGYSI